VAGSIKFGVLRWTNQPTSHEAHPSSLSRNAALALAEHFCVFLNICHVLPASQLHASALTAGCKREREETVLAFWKAGQAGTDTCCPRDLHPRPGPAGVVAGILFVACSLTYCRLDCSQKDKLPLASQALDADLATSSILLDLDHENKVTCATCLMPRTRLATPTEQGGGTGGRRGKTSAKPSRVTRGGRTDGYPDMAMEREPLRPKETERTSSQG
jgi:hypothetical protein